MGTWICKDTAIQTYAHAIHNVHRAQIHSCHEKQETHAMNKLFLKGVQLFSQSRTSWSMLVVLVVRSGMSWHNLCDKGRGVYSRMYQPTNQPTNQPTRHAVAPQVLPVAPIPAPASRSELTGTPSWMCNISIYAFCFGSTVYTVNMGHFTTIVQSAWWVIHATARIVDPKFHCYIWALVSDSSIRGEDRIPFKDTIYHQNCQSIKTKHIIQLYQSFLWI